MVEKTGQSGKRKRNRRELLIIVLFPLASIFLCTLSLILGVGNSAAEEFVPVSMRALNEGDYSVDNPLFRFQKANLDLIMEVLLDRDPLAADIAFRATAVANNLLTPVPTITPQFGGESITIDITPFPTTSMPPPGTQTPTKTKTATPTSVRNFQPTQTATTRPKDIPITWPTNTAPSSPSATPKPTKVPANPAPTMTLQPTNTATASDTATSTLTPTVTDMPTNTPTAARTATDIPASTPVLTYTPVLTPKSWT